VPASPATRSSEHNARVVGLLEMMIEGHHHHAIESCNQRRRRALVAAASGAPLVTGTMHNGNNLQPPVLTDAEQTATAQMGPRCGNQPHREDDPAAMHGGAG
jgi:hypothetical protein